MKNKSGLIKNIWVTVTMLFVVCVIMGGCLMSVENRYRLAAKAHLEEKYGEEFFVEEKMNNNGDPNVPFARIAEKRGNADISVEGYDGVKIIDLACEIDNQILAIITGEKTLVNEDGSIQLKNFLLRRHQ